MRWLMTVLAVAAVLFGPAILLTIATLRGTP